MSVSLFSIANARARNKSNLSKMKTLRKNFLSLLKTKSELQLLTTAFQNAQSWISRLARKHVMPKKRAANYISKMHKMLTGSMQ